MRVIAVIGRNRPFKIEFLAKQPFPDLFYFAVASLLLALAASLRLHCDGSIANFSDVYLIIII
jgi:hypothetical protein